MRLSPEFCILLAIAAALLVFGALRTRPVAIGAEPNPPGAPVSTSVLPIPSSTDTLHPNPDVPGGL